jgi:hypothetical protein
MDPMEDTNNNHVAVIMGDIVKSERSPSVEELHNNFNKAVNAQNKAYAKKLISPLTITLGDEFQGLTQKLTHASSIVRDMRLQLMEDAIDCRFVIGLVELKTKINKNNAWNMMGAGLARAREKLNEKKSNTLYRFAIEHNRITETTLDALGAGITLIERNWTEQQRQDISALISGASPAELAHRRNVTVHSIYKVRGSGNFETYLVQWSAICEILAALDKTTELS